MSLHPKMTTYERLRQRPFEHVIAAALLAFGVGRFFGIGPAVAILPPVLAFLWAAIGVAAALAVFVGLHWRGTQIMARAIERFGWSVALIIMFGGPFVLWLDHGTLAASGLIDDIAIGAGAILRILFLRAEGKAAKEALALIERHREGVSADGGS